MDNQLKLVQTADGSSTLYNPAIDEHYHSRHGAYAESVHVFIRNGLEKASDGFSQIRILEVGFGTGLNAWLTAIWAKHHQDFDVSYTGLEPFPLPNEMIQKLNYADFGEAEERDLFNYVHESGWGQQVAVSANFKLLKLNAPIAAYRTKERHNLVYFDAFAPGKQPELWTGEVFGHLASLMVPGGILVTYCAQGAFRRSLKQAGFQASALPGPPGKREMTIAVFYNSI